MDRLFLICVDDQREVLSTVVRDLEALSPLVTVEECESAAECRELMDEIDSDGDRVALVISDHVMPGENGVSLLQSIAEDGRFIHTRKVLLTGLATQQDTINAVNNARIDHYFDKPWQEEDLVKVARALVTEYLFDSGLDTSSRLALLDQETARRRLATVTY